MKRVKLDIGKGISDSMVNIKGVFPTLLAVFFINIALFVVQIFTNPSLALIRGGNPYEAGLASMPSFMLSTFLLNMLFSFIGLIMSNFVIRSVRNYALNKEESLGENLSFSFKKVFTFIVSMLFAMLTFIPLIIVFSILLIIARGSFAAMILMMIIMYGYTFMLLMVQQSLIVDDAGPIKAWMNSIKLVSHNYFRLLLIFIVLFGFLFALVFFMMKTPVLMIITSILLQIVSIFILPVVMTTLYLQTVTGDDDEPEVEYFDLDMTE